MCGQSRCSCDGCRKILLLHGCALPKVGLPDTGHFEGPDAEGRWLCGRCGVWMQGSQFYKNAVNRNGLTFVCRQCAPGRLQTMRGHGMKLLDTARQRDRNCQWHDSFALELDDLLGMLWLQGGRCSYSGVPLHCAAGPADWVWSIERLDNSVTYTKENCVLIAQEFQTSDHSRNRAAYPVFGTAQWSRSKANHIWGPYYPDREARVVQDMLRPGHSPSGFETVELKSGANGDLSGRHTQPSDLAGSC